MLASVIIPAFRSSDLLARCVDSLLATTGVELEVIVVDNGADAATRAVIQRLRPPVRVVCQPANLGFAGGINAGLAEARGDLLVFLNDDAEVEPDWLRAAAAAFAADPATAIVGAKVRAWDRRTLEHAGGCIGERNGLSWHRGDREPDAGQYDERCEVAYVTGVALAVRRSFYELYGGLETSYFMYYEEVEYCYAARRLGFRVVYEPGMVVYHLGRHGSGGETFRFHYLYHRGRLRFLLRNHGKRQLLWFLCHEPLLYVRRETRARNIPLLLAQLSLLPELPSILLQRRRHLRRFRDLLEEAAALRARTRPQPPSLTA